MVERVVGATTALLLSLPLFPLWGTWLGHTDREGRAEVQLGLGVQWGLGSAVGSLEWSDVTPLSLWGCATVLSWLPGQQCVTVMSLLCTLLQSGDVTPRPNSKPHTMHSVGFGRRARVQRSGKEHQ